MKRLAVMGPVCLLTACQWSLVHLLPDKPEKVAEFQAATAADLSDCVHRAAQSMRAPYAFHLNARADHLEFLITATEVPETTMRPTLSDLELHFLTTGESTTVEMHERTMRDHVLSRDIWSIVERCAQRVAEHSAEKSTAP